MKVTVLATVDLKPGDQLRYLPPFAAELKGKVATFLDVSDPQPRDSSTYWINVHFEDAEKEAVKSLPSAWFLLTPPT
jgi:hypothetical protein